eukprot:255102_1
MMRRKPLSRRLYLCIIITFAMALTFLIYGGFSIYKPERTVRKRLDISNQFEEAEFKSKIAENYDEDITTFVVTGSSENHYRSMVRLIQLVAEKLGDYNIKLIVYDLGLSPEHATELISEDFEDDLKNRGAKFSMQTVKFDFEKHPDWMRDLLKYAWKPMIIQDVIEQLGAERILWIDSGVIINDKFSKNAWNDYLGFLSSNGVACPEEQSAIRVWAHKGMIDYFKIPHDSPLLDKPEITASIIGLDLRVKNVKSGIIAPWIECASNIDCIAPEGSHVKNHRFDQAALAIILRQGHWQIDVKCIQQDYRFLTVQRDLEMGWWRKFRQDVDNFFYKH